MASAVVSEDWVGAQAVASATGLHVKTIYRLALTVEGFPVIPIGPREKRFVVSAVKAFIAEHPERMRAASEEYATKRNVAASRKKAPAKKNGNGKKAPAKKGAAKRAT